MNRNEIVKLGASLRRIDRKLLATESEQGGVRVWYQGGEPYFDLFVELIDSEVVWFQFTLRGQSLSWSRSCGREDSSDKGCWQTGKTNELQTDDLTFYSASKIIERDRHPDLSFYEVTHHILKTRAGENIFDQLLALFESH